jgi:TP901 family phage tail tape measure protein
MATEISKLYVTIGGNAEEFKKAMDDVSGSMKKAGAMIAALGAAITAAMGYAVSRAADFEKGMREVNTMMGLGQAEFSAFSDEVLRLATEMGVNAVEATHALYQAISAGIPKENAIEFLRIATQAAIGGVTDTETAVDGLTTVLNAFKIPVTEVEHVADVMFTTVKRGKTTFEELAAALYNVAPIAAAAGVSFEEVAAALTSITKQGTPTTVATTQLRAAITAVAAPTVEQSRRAQEMGVSLGQAEVAAKGLTGVFNDLMVATGGDIEKLRMLIGSIEGVQAIVSLTGQNAQTFADDLVAMGDAAGASVAAFDEMEESLSRQFEKLKEGVGGLAIQMGDVLAPAIGFAIEQVNKFIKWIGGINPVLFKVITIGIAVAGALALMGGGLLLVAGFAPMLIKAIGSLNAVTFPQMVRALGTVIKAMWSLVASFLAALAAAGPWAWAALATGIGLIAYGVWKAGQYSKQATAGLDETAQASQELNLSLGDGSDLLAEYNSKIGEASGSLGDLESATLDAAGAQGELAEGIDNTTLSISQNVIAARNLAIVLDDLIGYAKTFQGGMTEAEWQAFFEKPAAGLTTWYDKEGNIIFQGTSEEARKRARGEIPQYEATGFRQGTMLWEPTALFGLHSKQLLGIAGEAGPEPLGPTPEFMGQTIQIDFHIAQAVIREEPDIKKLGHAFYQEIAAYLRGKGIKG